MRDLSDPSAMNATPQAPDPGPAGRLSALTWREPTLNDAPALGVMHHASWVETYAAGLPADYFATWTVDHAVARWRELLGAPCPQGLTRWAVFEGERAVGFVVAGPPGAAGAGIGVPPARELGLLAIYVASALHGSGLGQRLLDRTVGRRPAELWVWEGNARARAFYARNGFAPDGAQTRDERFPDLLEVRLVR